MDYKTMWETLRKEVERELECYKRGEMMSLHESVQCEIKCKEFLAMMDNIENEKLA